MRSSRPFFQLLNILFFGMYFKPAILLAAPVVSNLNAAQRAGTKLVDVRYDLASPGFATVAVSLQASNDGGVTRTVTSLSGAIVRSVAPGEGKVIIWDAESDWPRGYSACAGMRRCCDGGSRPSSPTKGIFGLTWSLAAYAPSKREPFS
jgi:hypothetical protein